MTEFAQAITTLEGHRLRPEVHLEPVRAPGRIAPHSFALAGEVDAPNAAAASGKFIVLHDPAGQESWQGTYRIVTFTEVDLEAEMATDELLSEVVWTWVKEALANSGATYTAEGGTVTRVLSSSFAALAAQPAEAVLEIRASWTPTDGDLTRHLEAWAALLCTAAGLPPLEAALVPVTSGVTPLSPRRNNLNA